MDIIFTYSPNSEDIDCIYQGLGDFNQRFVPEITDESFAIFVRDKSGEILGGLTGFIYITSVQIRFLWLSEKLRNQGVGSALMQKIELICKEREISNIAVDTYTFQAPKFYESHGFKEIGRYKDYLVKDVDKIFYQKVLINN
ncbi:GNAT family N-acetyltransferase [Vibrio aestuarianus]|uniref:GNAT family N-acetyltransferase n=1 Tax=Vibrio aestuarianus TaxID=28171 RepID=UPI00237C5AE9|nr:GNAT family N-acetyltransferase [Vibrio aestuarianus]MDE1251217.1 GNAT family N-acetyltransferase [Vibrio aestuarianus]